MILALITAIITGLAIAVFVALNTDYDNKKTVRRFYKDK